MLSGEAIGGILADQVDGQRRSVGIVVGTIARDGKQVIARGARGEGGGSPLDGDTVFEIGSVAKVFTALLLVEMVQRGEVSLDDPLAKYLPAGVKVPERSGRKITLLDLATHTSGLPTWASNMPLPGDPALADYGFDQLIEFLSGYELTRETGAVHEGARPRGGGRGMALDC